MRRVAALVGALMCVPAVAGAAWTSSATGSSAAGADTMTNAADFTAACTNKTATSTVTLRWTTSPDLYVTGYTIVRTASNGTTATINIADRTTSSYTDAPSSPGGLTFTYTIRAVAGTLAWRTTALTASGRPSYTGHKNSCVTL